MTFASARLSDQKKKRGIEVFFDCIVVFWYSLFFLFFSNDFFGHQSNYNSTFITEKNPEKKLFWLVIVVVFFFFVGKGYERRAFVRSGAKIKKHKFLKLHQWHYRRPILSVKYSKTFFVIWTFFQLCFISFILFIPLLIIQFHSAFSLFNTHTQWHRYFKTDTKTNI